MSPSSSLTTVIHFNNCCCCCFNCLCYTRNQTMDINTPLILFLLFLLNYIAPGPESLTNFTFFNECRFPVWPAVSSASTNGLPLHTGKSTVFTAPRTSWEGSFWGRTNCSVDSRHNFTCTTGRCPNGRRDCAANLVTPPVTVVQFTLIPNSEAHYSVSLMDGFNLPVLVASHGNNKCSTIGCTADLNKICPPDQRFETRDGKVVGCLHACAVSTSGICGRLNGSSPSPMFDIACPYAYAYSGDDQNTSYTCRGVSSYNITFCPSANVSVITTPQTPPTRQSPPPPFPSLDAPPSPTSIPGTRSSTKGAKRRRIRIVLIVASAAVVLILAIALFTTRKIKQGAREKSLHELLTLDEHTETRGTRNHNLRLFSYESILAATNNFSLNNKLGEGGFGAVYKGQTLDGQNIAVKVLSQQSRQGLLEFKTELILISKLQHVNLVKSHGLCIHGDDKMIIYDYMPNKSLDFFLFSSSIELKLNWQQRFNIIEGIAQGLLYLHKYSRLKIIHRDLKPSNILLDENMNAKISDFGLAKVFERNIDEANTNRRVGTIGYMAPEYAMQGMYSVKSDIYSFGVLVLEIVSGRKNNSFHHIEGPLNLVEHAWDLWRNDSTLQLMDPTFTSSCNVEQLQRCIHIGLLCVENRAVDRPTSEDVILMLKSEMTSLPRPKNPSFIARNHVVDEASKKRVNSKPSVNEVTLSDIGGR